MPVPGMQNISLTNPYGAEAMGIERQRRLAELMQQKSMEPIQGGASQGPMGSVTAPISWTQGLAKMLQAYSGKIGQEAADKQTKQLGISRNQALAEALRGMPQETAAGPMPDPQEMAQSQDYGTPPVTQRPAQQPTMQQNASWLGQLAQIGPDASQIGGTMLGMQQKSQENQLNRESKTLDRIMALEEQSNNQALAREERAARATEAAALRRELQSNQQEFARQAQKDRAAMRPPQPIQPLVQVMGPNGPTWETRENAIGKMPAGAGSKAEAMVAGKSEIDKDVMTLKSALDSLKGGGGITSTEKGVVPNIGSWAANTGVGQTLGSMGGTTNQKHRDIILQARPLLLRSIMQATGMSAKNLDSNAELKLWLSTATDPTKGYEANVEALSNIAQKYGSGPIVDSTRSSNGQMRRRASDVGPPPGAVQRIP